MEVFVKEELDDEVEKIPLSPLFAHYDDDEEGFCYNNIVCCFINLLL